LDRITEVLKGHTSHDVLVSLPHGKSALHAEPLWLCSHPNLWQTDLTYCPMPNQSILLTTMKESMKQLLCYANLKIRNSTRVARGSHLRVDSSAKIFRCDIGIEHGDGNKIEVGEKTEIRRCKITIEGKGNTLKIGRGCNLRELHIEVLGHNCTIEIEDGVKNTGAGKLSCQELGTVITIGKNSLLAKGVTMLTSDGHDIYNKNGERINPPRNIIVEPHCWIGQDAMLLKGAHIGQGSIVGARSVVTAIIPPRAIAAGHPARIIKTDVSWDEKLTQHQTVSSSPKRSL